MTVTTETDDAEAIVNERTCIVSRQTEPAERLIRFVRGPNGEVVPDLKRRLPGRGAHVSLERAAVDEAMRRKLFARSFRAEVTGPADLGGQVDALLARSALGALGLARKAGQVVTGAAKVEAAVRNAGALFVVHAEEAAEDGIRKIAGARLAAAARDGRAPIGAVRLFAGEELDLALGAGNVIHAAILAGDAGSAAVKRLTALIEYRGLTPGADEANAKSAGCEVRQ